jgi:predicted peroxiredoxin
VPGSIVVLQQGKPSIHHYVNTTGAIMSGKFVVSLTRAGDDTDRATVAFVVANAAVASDKEVVVFLNVEGTRLSQAGYADTIHEPGFAPLKDLIAGFVEAGGKIFVCSPCFKKRSLDETMLIAGATIVGGAALVEFMGEHCPSLSY